MGDRFSPLPTPLQLTEAQSSQCKYSGIRVLPDGTVKTFHLPIFRPF